MQYVKIRYSIDMENVPKKILSLLKEMGESSKSCPKLYDNILSLAKNVTSEEASDIPLILKEMEALRESLYQLDIRMEDCYHMLKGYRRALIIEEDAEGAEAAFEPRHVQTPEYDANLHENVQKSVSKEMMAQVQEQVKQMTNEWQSTQASVEKAQQEAVSQLPSNMQGQFSTSTADLSGQQELMKNMMGQVMSTMSGDQAKKGK